jgi:lambda repressor-like predicted transcriptional regulator
MIRLKIKEVAQEKGVSMRRLSIEGHLAYKTVQNVWRNPYHEITMATLEKIAKFLGVRVGDLYEEVDDVEVQGPDDVKQDGSDDES